MSKISDLYVAQIAVPAALYVRADERGSIPNPNSFGLAKGYWKSWKQPDHLGTQRPVGLAWTVEFASSDLQAAEDKAIAAGLRLSQAVSVHSGSPLIPPELHKLARIGVSKGIWEQHEYFYLPEFDRLPQIEANVAEFQKLLDWFGRLSPDEAYHFELAARWYGMAVGANDVLDGYLAAWIGLESIGSAINQQFHSMGPKAPCQTCENKAGKDRDRGIAGIEHMVRLVAPELLSSRSVSDLAQIRNRIAHGLAPADELRNLADQLVPDLILVLGVAILTVTRPEDYRPGSGRAAAPRDYEARPDARASLWSSVELVRHRPYYGEWIPVERQFIAEHSRTEADGGYIWGAGVRVNWQPTVTPPVPNLKYDYIEFDRRGRRFVPKVGQGEPRPPSTGPWRQRPISDAWKRYMTVVGR